MFRWLLLIMAASVLTACAAPVAAPTNMVLPTLAPTVTARVEPTASPTPVPPTATAAPTETQVKSTRTSAAPTATSVPPTATAIPPSATASGPTDFTPTTASVWNFVQGPDQMNGACSGPILPPYGLVQITPIENGLTWRSQEPTPYTFAKVNINVYSFSGATATGDGTVTMTLSFISGTELVMTRTFVPNAEPACSHTHDYTGTFQWASN